MRQLAGQPRVDQVEHEQDASRPHGRGQLRQRGLQIEVMQAGDAGDAVERGRRRSMDLISPATYSTLLTAASAVSLAAIATVEGERSTPNTQLARPASSRVKRPPPQLTSSASSQGCGSCRRSQS